MVKKFYLFFYKFRTKIATNCEDDIATSEFLAFYSSMIADDKEKIKQEYQDIETFSRNLVKPCFVSMCNGQLNRYSNIHTFDDNRVVLDEDEFDNDYINASLIDVSSDRFISYVLIMNFFRAIKAKQNTLRLKDQRQIHRMTSGE